MGVDYLEIACFQAKNAQKHNSGESTVKDLRVANGPELNRPAHFLQENSEAFLLRAEAEPLPHPHGVGCSEWLAGSSFLKGNVPF